jgi:hypothetical protein
MCRSSCLSGRYQATSLDSSTTEVKAFVRMCCGATITLRLSEGLMESSQVACPSGKLLARQESVWHAPHCQSYISCLAELSALQQPYKRACLNRPPSLCVARSRNSILVQAIDVQRQHMQTRISILVFTRVNTKDVLYAHASVVYIRR